MATKTVSVSFANGFLGDSASTPNTALNVQLLTELGWSNVQFRQVSNTGQFTLQGNDLTGTVLITDAANVKHEIDVVINWRVSANGNVNTLVAYATGSTTYQLATKTGSGSTAIVPLVDGKTTGHDFIGLTFNGSTLTQKNGEATGNAATKSVVDELNGYLALQPQLTVSDLSVDEDGKTATVTVTLSKATSDTVTVKYATADSTAVAGRDYLKSEGTLVFGAQKTTASFQVPLIGNTTVDGARALDVVLSDSTFAAIVDNVGIVTITDNETAAPPPPLPVQSVAGVVAESGAASVVEGGMLKYLVTLSSASGSTESHSFALGGEAGASDIDLAHIGFTHGVTLVDGKLVVPAGVASFTVTLPTADDAAIERAETVTLTVGGVTGTGTITDNDGMSVAAVVAEDAARSGANPVDSSVEEGASLLYTVRLNAAGPDASEHTLLVSGTAGDLDTRAFEFSAGVHWKDKDPASGIVVVPAGVTSFTVLVPTVDDVLIETAETLVLTVGGVAATGHISDNDTQAVTKVLAEDAARAGASPVDATVDEGASLLYTVTLNGTSPVATEHALLVSGTAGSADYRAFAFSAGVTWKNNDAASGIVLVPAKVGSFTITVPTVDDSAVESAESLVLSVGGIPATGTIADNDRVGISSVLAEDAARAGANPVDDAVAEGATLQYTVVLNATTHVAEEFQLSLGGTADGADHAALVFSEGAAWKGGNPTSGIVVVQAGVSSFRITVQTTDDSAVEAAESLSISVGGVTGTGTITDNDSISVASVIAEDAAQVGLNPVDSTVTEGSVLRYSVHLSGAGIAATEFRLAFDGSASAADVAGIVFSDKVSWKDGDAAGGIIVVPAGVTSFKITVAIADDNLIELSESLVATVGGVSATGTITDDDSQSVSSIRAEDASNPGALPVDSSVVEGAALLFTVRFNGASPVATEHGFALGGSATAADLGAVSFGQGVTWKDGSPASGRIIVPAGVGAFTVTLQTTDDALVEATESAVLSIDGAGATGTITDNDSLAVSSVLAEDAANLGQNPHDSVVTEGGALRYTVTLSSVAARAAEFSLALGGTATDADLGALAFSAGVAWKNGDAATGIVIVPAGVGSFTVALPTIDDAIVESSESAVLVVGGVHATGTLLDNDYVPPAPAPVEPAPTPAPAPAVPPPPPAPVLATGLDPASDDGASNSDTVTGVRTPEFTLQGIQLTPGGSVRLLSPEGSVVGASTITEADALAGKVNVGPGPLDDGVYTYVAQLMDASGKVVASAPVTVTVVTDLDGVTPSIELAAHGGDFNHDGVLDWQQHSVAHMPLRSLADFALGKNAPVAAFGAVMAGSLSLEAGDVQLTQGAQLKDLSLTDLPSALPEEFRAASPVFNFTVGAEEGVPSLPDLDPSRAGLQTRVVIDLGANGAVSNNFMKFDHASQSWYSFLDDQDLSTMDDGATLVDLNQDGRVDRIVLTLTDGARGDDDGVADGKIVDPGLLAFDTIPPDQVYSVRLSSGETYYTADILDAQVKSSGTGNVFLGVAFDSMVDLPEAKHVSAFYQPFTQDLTYTIDGAAQPYACYEVVTGASGFQAMAAGKAQVNIHLYQNARGMTELVSSAQAQQLGLAAQGYLDRGAQFSVSMDNAFKFDAEGYLIANQENASVQALVKQLAGMYGSTSAAGFVEAVEQNYFEQIKLVGVAHGAAASAADLNAVFGTGFGN